MKIEPFAVKRNRSGAGVLLHLWCTLSHFHFPTLGEHATSSTSSSLLISKVEAAWARNVNWKARYTKLYSSGCISTPAQEAPSRISFMSNESSPYASLLMRVRSSRRDSLNSQSSSPPPDYGTTLLRERSETYSSPKISLQADDLGGHETKLLDMVRASRELNDEVIANMLDIPKDNESDDDQSNASEACVHVLSMRQTERSMSRSRFSRMSTRRDMDIPSILAFTASSSMPAQFQIPAFQKAKQTNRQEDIIPRWSIRRSVCPVCSQKWRDRSTIRNVKYSGLKRNAAQEFPSVIAPGRLRASITMEYVPRPALPVVDEDSPGYVVKRNTSATWQLTRARRFRAPKPNLPSPEATAPLVSTAPLAQKDLDLRVNKFLKDE